MFATRRTNSYQGGQNHMYGCGRKDRQTGTQVGVIYAPGAGGDETSWQTGTSTNPNQTNAVIQAICDHRNWQPGKRVVTFADAYTWGNGTVVTQIGDLWTYAQNNHNFSSTKVHLVAVSMGGPCVLNWAKANPTKVASLSLMLPAVDIQDINDNNRATQFGLPQPSTAFGNARPDDAHTPARNAASFSGMALKIWYSTNDEIIIPSTITTFASGSGCTLQSLGDQPAHIGIPGHSLDSGFDPLSVASWIDAHP